MTDERILEIIENQDKYYILGFIKGIKANNELLQQENKKLKEDMKVLFDENQNKEQVIIKYQEIIDKAIEYIENTSNDGYIILDVKEDLLKILKGEE